MDLTSAVLNLQIAVLQMKSNIVTIIKIINSAYAGARETYENGSNYSSSNKGWKGSYQ